MALHTVFLLILNPTWSLDQHSNILLVEVMVGEKMQYASFSEMMQAKLFVVASLSHHVCTLIFYYFDFIILSTRTHTRQRPQVMYIQQGQFQQ
jgi:hypothetical protein